MRMKNDVKKGRSCRRSGMSLPPSTSVTRRPGLSRSGSPASRSICRAVASRAASAAPTVTPAFRRPSMRKMARSRRSSVLPASSGAIRSPTESGNQRSAANSTGDAPRNSFGPTATMVAG